MTPVSHNTPLLFRHAILLQLAVATPVALNEEILRTGLQLAGHEQNISQLSKALHYLVSKKFICEKKYELSQGEARFQITAKGTDYLENEGFYMT